MSSGLRLGFDNMGRSFAMPYHAIPYHTIAFKANTITGIKLNDEVRAALIKPTFQRDNEDLKHLAHIVAVIPPFQVWHGMVLDSKSANQSDV